MEVAHYFLISKVPPFFLRYNSIRLFVCTSSEYTSKLWEDITSLALPNSTQWYVEKYKDSARLYWVDRERTDDKFYGSMVWCKEIWYWRKRYIFIDFKLKKGGKDLLNEYNGSIYELVKAVHSRYEWLPWKFTPVPRYLKRWEQTLIFQEISGTKLPISGNFSIGFEKNFTSRLNSSGIKFEVYGT